MRRWTLALVCVLPVLGSGCSYAQNLRRNLVAAPQFAFAHMASQHRSMQMGREAYLQMASRYGDHEFSCDYRRGFVDGFADYLDFGGVGEPPPIPPTSYRFFGYMTPGGLAAMEDWTVGFRHGAATAKASGLRELVVVPVYWGPNFNSPSSAAGSNSPPTNGNPTYADVPPATSPVPSPPPTPQPALQPAPQPAPASPPATSPVPSPPPAPAKPAGELKPAAYRKSQAAASPANDPGQKPSVPPPSKQPAVEPATKPAVKKPAAKRPVNPGDKPSVPPPSTQELPPERY